MSLWLLLIAHLLADFSLQSADWAKKKTQKFRYLAGHSLVYAVVLAIVAFSCISGGAARMPFIIIVFSHFLIDWIRVRADKKYKTPTAHFASFLIDQVLHVSIICASAHMYDLNAQSRGWLSDLASTVPLEQILRYVLIFIIILEASPHERLGFVFCDRGCGGCRAADVPPGGYD